MTRKLPSRAYLRTKLLQPLPAKDGSTLLTIHDAVEYVATLPKERTLRPYWQQTSRSVASSRGHRSNLDHFADADRRVSELKERISRQCAVIERAKQRGRPTGAAESILHTLATSLRSFERHRERIFGRLDRGGDDSR